METKRWVYAVDTDINVERRYNKHIVDKLLELSNAVKIPKDKEFGKGKRSCVCIRNRMKNYISSTLAKKETFHFSTL